MKTAKEVLVAARELISDPARWTKGCEARNAQGHSVFPKVFSYTPEDRLPVCWCAGGALSYVTPETTGVHPGVYPARRALDMAASRLDPRWHPTHVDYNDDPQTKHADVLKMFDLAIESVREDGK